MTSIQDLLDEINSTFDVVQLVERGTTAGGLIYCYDLWYRVEGLVKSKRFNIYYSGTGDAEWYGSNPIPSIPDETFIEKISNKILDIVTNNTQIKYLAIDSVNEMTKQAIIIGYKDDGSEVTKISAYIWEDTNGDLQYKVF